MLATDLYSSLKLRLNKSSYNGIIFSRPRGILRNIDMETDKVDVVIIKKLLTVFIIVSPTVSNNLPSLELYYSK